MNKTVAVTGGSGYIAGYVIAEFLNNGYKVKTSLRNIDKLVSLKQDLLNYVSNENIENLSAFKADLNSSENWCEAFKGVDGIIHVASPLGTGVETLEELKAVAVGGTLNVMKAALEAGVGRIVMTSSLAASTERKSAGKVVLDETFWSDETNTELDPYRLSKIASEKAAWKFANENNMELTTILPGSVFGEVMNGKNLSSNEILLRLVNGGIPRAFNVPFETSNVVDLAKLHFLAFENDKAIGERFLAASQTITMPDVAKLITSKYPDTKTPKKVFNDISVKVLAKFVPPLRSMVPMLNRQYTHTTEKAEKLLGWKQQTPTDTIVQAVECFYKFNLIKK